MKMKILFVASIFLLMALGCNTAPPQPINSELITYEIADLTVTLQYLDEATLIARHGQNYAWVYTNPYYGYPGLITKKRLSVFEFEAKSTESHVEFKLNDISLEIGDVGGDAKSRPYLKNIWSHYRSAKTTAMDIAMKKTILKREFTISPDEPVSGYLVFGENYPEEGGEGLITMHVSTPSGDKGSLEIPLHFSASGTVDDSAGEAGIFGEE